MSSQDWPKLGQYVDFRDRDHVWQVGLVVFKNQHCIKITIEGLGQHYDEIIPLSDDVAILKNPRLQPFRSHIRGFASARKSLAIRERWKYSRVDHQSRLEKFQNFIKNIRACSSWQVIQFLRGQHYFYIDFLMSNVYPQYQDVVKVYDYFMKHIVFLQSYLNNILDRGVQETFINKALQCSEDQLWQQTYDNCYYELIQALFNISGLQDRLTFFIKTNQKHIKEIVGVCQKHEYYISNQILTVKLYDSIIALITQTHKSLFSSMNEVKFPFSFSFSLFQLFLVIENIFRLEGIKQQAAESCQMLFAIIEKMAEEIEPNDMKQVQTQRQLEYLLIYLRSTATKYKKEEMIANWPQKIRIKICLLLLRCDKLQKKMRGINKLRDLAERIVKEQFFNLNLQEFHELLNDYDILEELFVHNQHVQLFKKSIDFVFYLYKFDVIEVDDLIYVWNNSINKHPLIVSILLQFWIQIANILQFSDLECYVQTVLKYYQETKIKNAEFIDFFFDLIISVSSSSIRGPQCKNYQTHNQKVNAIIKDMMIVSYQMLKKSMDQPYFLILVSKYSSTVVQSIEHKKIIETTFSNLTNKEEFQVSLQILHEIYVNQERNSAFVPKDYAKQLLSCLRLPKVDRKDIECIMNIIDSIINAYKGCLNPEEFETLWVYFQSIYPQYKSIFYELILPQKTQEIDDNINFFINIGFSCSLKMFILDNILTNKNFINYSSLTKKQLSIILQLFIQVNSQEHRIERKKILEGYRFINRVKTVELIHDGILWNIFEQCKQQDVINYLIRNMVKFYFYLSSSLPSHLKKSRIDFIMDKIIKNIKESKPNNTRLLINSLQLLKSIFEMVRIDQMYFYPCENQPKPYTTKLEIKYLGKHHKIQVLQNETMTQFKCRLASVLKIKLKNLLLTICDENRNDELDYAYKGYTIGILKKSIIQITEREKDEETISHFVASFIDQDLQVLLINMLENESVTTQVFSVIEELELKLDKNQILKKIDKILESEEKDNRKSMNIEIFYHLLEIKIYSKLLETDQQTLDFIQTPSFQRILKCIKYQISRTYQIQFLSKIQSLLEKVIKKAFKHKITINLLKLLEYIFSILLQTTKYIIQIQGFEENIKKYSVKITHNCISTIDRYISEDSQIIDFYIEQPTFEELFEKLYLKSEVEEIRMLFTDKLKHRLHFKGKPDELKLSKSAEQKLLSLFIDNMYFKIKEQQLNQTKFTCQNDAVNEFFQLLDLLISNLSPVGFNETQVMQPIKGRHVSLYEESLNFMESLKLFTSSDFHWNTLLIGHFHILSAIFEKDHSLLSTDIVNFALRNSLALSCENVYEPLCKKIENINEVFKFLERILVFNKETKYVKLIIDTIKPCHSLELWRVPASLSWTFNSKQDLKQAFRGLVNPGCICYMNSLLQQLFMIDDFRLSVLSFGKSEQIKEEGESSGSQQTQKMVQEETEGDTEKAMIQSLKDLFLKLQFSQENCINPINFAKTLKTNDKRPMIKISQQMDIDEFASIFFQKIEKVIKNENQPNFVNQLFGGVYAHEIISKECSHTSEREEQFISISLEVKESIIKSFESLVKTQILDGANKYHCEKCDKKVRAQKVQTIKQLPPYLILCLKRFQFDYDIDAKIKINDYCQFPLILNLLEYSQQEILKAKSDLISEDDEHESLPSSYFQYQLKGVVVHTGSADSGHYYSFIDNRQGTWYQFNDDDVLPFDLNRMAEQAFGCRSHRHDMKTKNAYLLLYQRKSHKSLKKEEEESIMKRQQHQVVIEKIFKKNRQIRKQEIIFSEQYEELIQKIEFNLAHTSDSIDLKRSWFEFQLSFYFLVKARKENVQSFFEYSKKIYNKIDTDPQFCLFFLKIFTSPKFIEEFFIYNPVREKCKIVAYLLSTSLQSEYKRTKSNGWLDKNEIIFRVLACFNAVFIYHSPIGELLTVIRKFLDILRKEDNNTEFYIILEKFDICKAIFNAAFNILFDKRTKIESQQYCKSNQWDIPFLAPLPLIGRRVSSINYSQAWKITALLLNVCNQFLEQPEFQKVQKRDLYLNKIDYFKRIFKEGITQNKINTVIMDSSSKKALFYFYYTLKELGVHLKVLPYFEKAIKDLESIKYRSFFMYLETIINDSEIETSEKVKILDLIERGYKANDKYFLQTDNIHQWVLKFASQNEQFLDLLDSKRNFTQQIFDRISKTTSPTVADLKNRFKHQVNQKIINRLNGIVISPDYKDYETNILKMKKHYDEIINLNFTCRQHYYPPEDNFQVGQNVEYFDTTIMKWKKATIVENKLGHLKLQIQNKDFFCFLWEDSDKLRKFVAGRNTEQEPTPVDSELSYESQYQSDHSK